MTASTPKGRDIALLFHETYERLAPEFGYETRLETRVFDPESANGKLMIAVCSEVLGKAISQTVNEFADETIRVIKAADHCDLPGHNCTHEIADEILKLKAAYGEGE